MEPHWTSYVGMVTGVVGALTGVAGAIMGWVAFNRSNELATTDRRLELQKLRNAAHTAVVGLIDSMPKALGSRKAILNTRGVLHSSMMKQFQEGYDADNKRAQDLAAEIPRADADFDGLSLKEIEKHIVALDRTRTWIEDLRTKYENSLAEDDASRRELRADKRASPPDRSSGF